MENREGEDPVRAFSTLWRGGLCLLLFILAAICFAGCAAPGEPTTRREPAPTPISDLAAVQQGDAIILLFTLPAKTIERKNLPGTPSIEIYRRYPAGSAANSGTNSTTDSTTSEAGVPGAAPSFSPQDLVVRIPSAMVNSYLKNGRIHFPVAMKPEELEKHGGELAQFAVRTRVSEKKASDISNVATIRLFYPAMRPISDLTGQVTADAIELSWSAPALDWAGDRAGKTEYTVVYRVYRSEIHEDAAQNSQATPAETEAVTSEGSAHTGSAQVVLPPSAMPDDAESIGASSDPHFRDTKFEFGHSYAYSVRSRAGYGSGPGQSIESADSNLLAVTPQDIFPPAAPEGVIAEAVAAAGDVPAHIELSWAISPESDLSGYNVYRKDLDDTHGRKLTARPLPTPAYRDMTVVLGRVYTYTITAVDRAGNESPASVPATAGLSAAEQNERSQP